MDKDLTRIVNLVNDIQIAAQGEKDPSDNRDEYIADVNARITDMESGISVLKFELTRQDLGDWE